MGQYNKAVLTTAGEKLIARVLAGEIKLSITKAKTSSYEYPGGTDFKSLTDMQGIEQTMTDPTTCVYDNAMIQTRVLFSNKEVVSTYYIYNIGLYVMDGTQEVLFCIVTAEIADEMPQYNGVASTSYIYNIQNVVQDAAELNITVNPNGTATIQDVMERVDATGGDISETVIETLDIIEDKYPVPAAGESVKRFFGKLLTFLKNIRPLTGDINIYVSANTGSDITGDGGELNPYASIGKALSVVPKNLNGFTTSIYVSDGTYAEIVNINGIKNGSLILRRNGNEELNSLCNVSKITASFCGSISILGFNLTAENMDSTYFNNCEFVYINCCQSIENAPSNQSFSFDYVSVARVTGCRSINHQNCLRSYSSYIYSGSWSGDSVGNVYGIYVDGGGRIAIGNVYQPTGMVLNEYYAAGGIITGVFGAKVGTLKSDIILYVSTTGSDITGNGTSENPFKTIQHAIDIIPKDLGGHNVNIQIANGVYDEKVTINGFHSGTISLNSSTPTNINTDTGIRCVEITCCEAYIKLSGIYVYGSNTNGASINITLCNLVTLLSTLMDSSSTWGVNINVCNNFRFNSGNVSNKVTAIKFVDASGYVTNVIGSNNGTGLYADGSSVVHRVGNQPIATTPVIQAYGAMIVYDNGTQILGLISYGLSCAWGTIQGGHRRIGNVNGVAQIVVNMRITITQAMTAGTVYTVNGFPLVADGFPIACTVDDFYRTKTCYVTNNASNAFIYFIPLINLTTGQTLNFSATYITNS
ncbi:hypothetical protein [Lacrimispora sp.]|uniref:hypothetical protein n=1 Tax=Lacrimispora sp. TaxID=2719234 RepID=UPI0032E3FA10